MESRKWIAIYEFLSRFLHVDLRDCAYYLVATITRIPQPRLFRTQAGPINTTNYPPQRCSLSASYGLCSTINPFRMHYVEMVKKFFATSTVGSSTWYHSHLASVFVPSREPNPRVPLYVGGTDSFVGCWNAAGSVSAAFRSGLQEALDSWRVFPSACRSVYGCGCAWMCLDVQVNKESGVE